MAAEAVRLGIDKRTKFQRADSRPPVTVIMHWPVGPKKRPTSPEVQRGAKRFGLGLSLGCQRAIDRSDMPVPVG